MVLSFANNVNIIAILMEKVLAIKIIKINIKNYIKLQS